MSDFPYRVVLITRNKKKYIKARYRTLEEAEDRIAKEKLKGHSFEIYVQKETGDGTEQDIDYEQKTKFAP
jgi:hypothetical protein